MPGSSARATWLYLLLFPIAGASLWFLYSLGHDLHAPDPAPGVPRFDAQGAGPVALDTFIHVLLALAVIMIAARAIGALFRVFRQPPVMGEVIAGILLGPSALGHVWPAASAYLVPSHVAPVLSGLAEMGVLLYMFIVGLELDPGVLRGRTSSTITVSHASILVPFVLGVSVALYTYPRYSSNDVPFMAFALFGGVALSITAFPVLARILSDRQLQRTEIGAIALACAAVDDVTAWCLLALVVSVARATMSGAGITLALAVAYVAVMLIVVSPWVRRAVRWVDTKHDVSRTAMTFMFAALLISALITSAIGIHALFGAFLLGAIIPHDSQLAARAKERLEDVVLVLLLPAFFAYTGLRTEIGLVSGSGAWFTLALICAAASAGKFGGAFASARLTGLSTADSAMLGALMNTRGLMELIALNVGLDLRVLSPTLFAMMVLMSLITTLIATPVVDYLTPRASLAKARR